MSCDRTPKTNPLAANKHGHFKASQIILILGCAFNSLTKLIPNRLQKYYRQFSGHCDSRSSLRIAGGLKFHQAHLESYI